MRPCALIPSALSPDPNQPPGSARRGAHGRALIEVLLCSDYPTQLAIGATLAAFGSAPHRRPAG